MGLACCLFLCRSKALDHTAVNHTLESWLRCACAVAPFLPHGTCALRLQMNMCVFFFFKWASREEFLFEGSVNDLALIGTD